MPLIPTCRQSIKFCAARVTRLNADGTVATGPNNAYVLADGSGDPISLGYEQIVTEGDEKEVVSGCDKLVATYTGSDKPRGFNLTLAVASLSPAMIEIITGAPAITDGTGNIIGWHWPSLNTPASPVAF